MLKPDRSLLAAQLERVASVLPSQTTAFRWLDRSELTVDRFGDVAALNLYEPLEPSVELEWAQVLMEVGSLTAVYVKRRPKDAHHTASESQAPVAPLMGTAVDSLEIEEAGLRFEIRPANGLSVGLYLDARAARGWVRRHAKGKTVANWYAYTCGFGVAALAGGATRAVNVDLSRKVLDWGAENTRRNGFEVSPRDFISGDTFDWLARFSKKGERFEVVVLDPPGFASSKAGRFSAARDYHRLVSAAAPVVAVDGLLLAMCNVGALSSGDFERQLSQGLGGRAFDIVESFGASTADFAPNHALKCVALRLGR